MMSIKGKAYIAGAYEHPTRKAPDTSVAQLHAESAAGTEIHVLTVPGPAGTGQRVGGRLRMHLRHRFVRSLARRVLIRPRDIGLALDAHHASFSDVDHDVVLFHRHRTRIRSSGFVPCGKH